MIGEAQRASIRYKAEVLLGASLGDQGDLLTEMAAEAALAWCCREDIPQEMEQAVAALTVARAQGGSAVKSLTRGDTSITYDTGGSSGMETLAPWRRLGRLKEG